MGGNVRQVRTWTPPSPSSGRKLQSILLACVVTSPMERTKENPVTDELVLVDFPLPQVKRVTMNRPEKRNALFHPLRGAIMDALREGDMDDEIKVMIVRGNGPSFSAGYDLGGGNE